MPKSKHVKGATIRSLEEYHTRTKEGDKWFFWGPVPMRREVIGGMSYRAVADGIQKGMLARAKKEE